DLPRWTAGTLPDWQDWPAATARPPVRHPHVPDAFRTPVRAPPNVPTRAVMAPARDASGTTGSPLWEPATPPPFPLCREGRGGVEPSRRTLSPRTPHLPHAWQPARGTAPPT